MWSGRVLDIGCGNQTFKKPFEAMGLKYYGIDRRIVSEVKTNENGIDKRKDGVDVDKQKLPCHDNVFSLVFVKSVLEHCHDPLYVLSEVFRVLRPGGRCICLSPDWVSQFKTYFDCMEHRTPITCKGLDGVLRLTGFCEVENEIFLQLPWLWGHPLWHRLLSFLHVFLPSCFCFRKDGVQRVTYRFLKERMVLGTGVKPKGL